MNIALNLGSGHTSSGARFLLLIEIRGEHVNTRRADYSIFSIL